MTFESWSKDNLLGFRGCMTVIILIFGGAVLGGWVGVGIGILIIAAYLWIQTYLAEKKKDG